MHLLARATAHTVDMYLELPADAEPEHPSATLMPPQQQQSAMGGGQLAGTPAPPFAALPVPTLPAAIAWQGPNGETLRAVLPFATARDAVAAADGTGGVLRGMLCTGRHVVAALHHFVHVGTVTSTAATWHAYFCSEVGSGDLAGDGAADLCFACDSLCGTLLYCSHVALSHSASQGVAALAVDRSSVVTVTDGKGQTRQLSLAE